MPLRRLSPMDNAFLLLGNGVISRCTSAASCYVQASCCRTPGLRGPLAERLRQSTQAAAPFNQRLVSHLGVKFWEEDSEFDLAHHFVHLALPRPGRIRELLAMVSRVHSAHLDRAYPLWRTYLIEGLEDGRIAMYSKIHHAVVDGVAALRVMVKTMSPDRARIDHAAAAMGSEDTQGTRRATAVSGAAIPPPAGCRRCRRCCGVAGSRCRLSSGSCSAVGRTIVRIIPIWSPGFSAPRCILNQKITGSRRWHCAVIFDVANQGDRHRFRRHQQRRCAGDVRRRAATLSRRTR